LHDGTWTNDGIARLKHISVCSVKLQQWIHKLKLFPAVIVNSGTPALNLEEALSDEMLLIVASELIVSVPSYLA